MIQLRPKILIIDDEESICWGLAKLCSTMSIDCEMASSVEAGFRLADREQFQAIILDVRLPGMDGLEAIRAFHDRLGKIPIITITAFGDLTTAITAVQNGAFEYITKPFELATVQRTIAQAIAAWNMSHAVGLNGTREAAAEPERKVGELIGTSPVMQEVFKQIALTTTTDSPVLITGESGTGKELTARAIHCFSHRAAGQFVAVNIASLNPTLAESELFGHVKGAFTGADSDRVGLIQNASGGTLFLDEVAEIPLEIQVKLLRVLDQGEVTPVGSNRSVKTDFRLLSATNQNLLSQINHGEFRHDLFYRLRTFEIQLPPLRDHREDIPALAGHFIARAAAGKSFAFAPGFIEALTERSWPGNVRELRSALERAVILAQGGILTADLLEQSIPIRHANHEADLQSEIRRLTVEWINRHWQTDANGLYEEFLRVIDPAILSTAFQMSDRQYSAAARRLGIHRTTLKKKLDETENPPTPSTN